MDIYTVTQADGAETTVTEKLNGVQIKAYTAVLGQENTFEVTPGQFLTLLNGVNTMTVEAAAEGRTATYTVTFSKGVYALTITMPEPMTSDNPITKMVMNVTRNIPSGALFEVLVTNNANDETPVWEDATASVTSGINYLFSNTTAENGNAFNFKVSASRGTSSTGGSISSIGGAFE